MVKEPLIVKNILTQEKFNTLSSYLKNKEKSVETYDEYFGRYGLFNDAVIDSVVEDLTIAARKYFNNESLLLSYYMFAHYEGEKANLYKHKDDNACTYTLDMCVYQNQTWDLWVDDKPYTLYPNEALAYYGNDQLHWREKFPNPESQHVAMIFFHFVEPNHWWFIKGPDYLQVIRGLLTEEQWQQTKQQ